MEPIHWVDTYYKSPKRIVLTEHELNVPGLKLLGKHDITTAIPPLPEHFHENCIEITYLAGGTLSFFTNHSEYKISGGNVFLSFPNEVHSTNENPLSIGGVYWCQLDVTELSRFLFLQEEAAEYLIESLTSIPYHVVKMNQQDITPLIRSLFSLAQIPGKEYELASCMTIFLHQIINFSSQTQFRLTPDIGKTVDFIMQNLNEQISLSELADSCYLSLSQFKQKFKNQVGMSPRDFVNYYKIELSKNLLQEGRTSTEIAMELGFSSSSYFSAVFKRYTARTPMQYLKEVLASV